MSNIAIRVENLSKQYKIGGRRPRHDSLTEHIFHAAKSLLNGRQSPNDNYIWALKDVSFDVKHGEVVGFIGNNGAGKSTMLKILSRITPPTKGRAEICGRVGSLLEVGTGFHGELTGRENIYLNGAILGMKKWEIDKKFDEIVVFSEIEKFIDTPVKRYSSGMYVRLAFAVAAHLEPEILIVDEVLAVGDAAFRFKCMDKMQEIREKGHTILLVSHNMDAITRICEQVFLLQAGRVTQSGTPQGVIPAYLALAQNVTSEKRWDDIGKAPGNEVVRLHGVRVCAEDGATVSAVDIRLPVGIEVEYEVLQNGHVLIPNCHFYNEEGLHLFAVQDVKSEWRHKPRPPGSYLSTAWIPGNFLAEGGLTVDINISSHIPATVLHVSARKAVGFQVIESRECDSARGDYTGPFPGVVRPLVCWSTSLNKLRLPKP